MRSLGSAVGALIERASAARLARLGGSERLLARTAAHSVGVSAGL